MVRVAIVAVGLLTLCVACLSCMHALLPSFVVIVAELASCMLLAGAGCMLALVSCTIIMLCYHHVDEHMAGPPACLLISSAGSGHMPHAWAGHLPALPCCMHVWTCRQALHAWMLHLHACFSHPPACLFSWVYKVCRASVSSRLWSRAPAIQQMRNHHLGLDSGGCYVGSMDTKSGVICCLLRIFFISSLFLELCSFFFVLALLSIYIFVVGPPTPPVSLKNTHAMIHFFF